MTGESFIDVDFCQQAKAGQVVAGDVFLSRKIKEEGRIISVLSDGLGSGVKASVLANLTATMALRYTSAFVDVRQSAKTIMDTLPVCEKRKISYSTFTIVDLDEDGKTRVIEHGNPPLVLLRGQTPVPIERASFTLEAWKDRVIHYSEFDTQLGDRIVYFSDGVSQSGLGRAGLPLGWGQDRVDGFSAANKSSAENEISSRELSRRLVAEAADERRSRGEGRHHLRRDLLSAAAPAAGHHRPAVQQGARRRTGRTGANFQRTESHLRRHHGEHRFAPAEPAGHDGADATSFRKFRPPRRWTGVDLVTEGTVTLAKAAEMLERGAAGRCRAQKPRKRSGGADAAKRHRGIRRGHAHQRGASGSERAGGTGFAPEHRPQNRLAAGEPLFQRIARAVHLIFFAAKCASAKSRKLSQSDGSTSCWPV